MVPEFPISGSLIFHSNMDGDNEIYLMTNNSITQLTDNTWNDEYPAWSPDGTQIAFTANREGHYDIFMMETDGSNIIRLTTSKADEKEPSWFPDGKSIAYSSEIKKFIRKQLSLWHVDIQTKKTKRIIPGYNKGHAIPHVSPLGNLLTFTGKRTMGWDAAMYDSQKNDVLFLDEGGKSCRARFSKDGKKLAYVSSKSDGKGDIWIMNPDGTEKMRLTERNETYDYFPAWSPDNKFVVFNSSKQHNHNGDWALYVIDIETRKARLLFDSPGSDVFPDWR
jgi:Tol biopolymer transport system component